MNILGIIPARGGSKGLPKKNVKILDDKPLIAWSIQAALESKKLNAVIVSSDNKEIIDVSKKHGAEVPFVRPDSLSTDSATTKDVIVHALNHYSSNNITFDYVVLLQPTSPFRKEGDIDLAIKKAIETNADMVVSVKETSSNPYYVLFEEDENGYLKKSKEAQFTRRQDCPVVYEYNGSIYVIKVSSLLKTETLSFKKIIKFEMDASHSIDIDNQLDFDFAEFMINKIS